MPKVLPPGELVFFIEDVISEYGTSMDLHVHHKLKDVCTWQYVNQWVDS